MNVKQTMVSASLVVALGGPAHADPAVGVAVPAKQGTGTFEVGTGYVTDDGFFARATVAQANLFGTGNLLALDAFVSERHQFFDLRFANPHFLETDLRLDASVYADTRVLPGVTRNAVGGKTQLTRQLSDHLNVFVGYRLEHVSATGENSLVRTLTPEGGAPPLTDYNLSAIRTGVAYSTLDAPYRPRTGSAFGASLELSAPSIGSQVSYARLDAYAGTHLPLGPATLHLTGRVAGILGNQLPMSERLFLEGSRDLPGFLPGGLGPSNGANFLALGRAEIEVPVARSIGLSVVGFYSAGTLYDTHGTGGVGQSVGVGLLWRSPIGPLEIDVAMPIGGQPGIVFGIGQSF